eukprot:UC1_evm4s808
MAMHQIVRALCPAATVILTYLLQGKRYSEDVLLALVVIFLGVVLYAGKGDIDYTAWGLIMLLFGVFLASLKGVVTNIFMVGTLRLNPLDLLQYMSAFAFLQMFTWLALDGTLTATIDHLKTNATSETLVAIAVNGTGAFLLNIVSFTANKVTSPLAMNIGGITKQILAIVLAIVVFHSPTTRDSLTGVAITVAGIIWYARSSFVDRQKAAAAAAAAAATTAQSARQLEEGKA